MGKTTGFLEWQRVGPPKREVAERLRDFKEIYREQPEAVVREQGGRCMDCGVPFCQQGCPLGNMIPDWNDAVYRGEWDRAYRRLSATNNFPEFTGRLCPAPCEAACVLAIDQPAVTIEQLEKEIIERAFSEGWVEPRPPAQPTGRHVAVVGSGPAGLAAAQQLRRAGHRVTLYEADDRIGGMLRYGIPDFKMEKWVIDRRLAVMEAEGVELRTGVRVGDEPTWAELKAQHDAVVVALGARVPRDLDVPGRELGNVCFAMDFLEEQNRLVAGDSIEQRFPAAGKRVVVLGGGDTGSDCFGTSLRQGAADVVQIEIFPAPPETRAPGNPWPKWPIIFRTSSSHEEGGRREFAVQITEILGDGGVVRALRAVRVEVERTASGPRIAAVPGSEHEIPCDLLVLAIGFLGPDAQPVAEQLGVELDRRGNVAATGYQTNVPGVFVAGDAMRGPSLIVWAISDGREAARAVDAYLRDDHRPRLPTLGASTPF